MNAEGQVNFASLSGEEQVNYMKEFLKNYHSLNDDCFKGCINDFTSRKVARSEDTCVTNCVEKLIKANQRISTRFQEAQMIANENVMAALKKAN